MDDDAFLLSNVVDQEEGGSEAINASHSALHETNRSVSSEEEDDIVTQLLQVRSFDKNPPLPSSFDDTDLPVANAVGRYARTTDVAGLALPPLEHIEFVENERDHPLEEEEPLVNYEAFHIDAALVSSHQFQPDATLSDAKDASVLPVVNGYGIVHVRVLRAQHLSCPVHSHCSIVYRLHPWKGKVRSPLKVTTFVIPAAFAADQSHPPHGVCADWGESLEDNEFIKLVHACTDPRSSPIPTIQLDLLFSPFGFVEFTMCSFRLDATRLLQKPHQVHSQWFTTTGAAGTAAAAIGDSTSATIAHPWLQVEALFEPATTTNVGEEMEAPPLWTRAERTMEPQPQSEDTTSPEVDLATLPGDASITMQSKANTARTVSSLSPQQHLLQRTQYRWTPAVCGVCHTSLLSPWKSVAWRCERCSVDCCADCRLHVDVQLPCGSDAAQQAVRQAIQNQWNLDQLLHVIAPVDAATARPDRSERSAEESVAAPADPPVSGIGVLHIQLSRASILKDALPAEADPQTTILSHPPPPLRPGDYYVRILWGSGGHVFRKDDSVRTRTIQQCSGRMNLDFEQEILRFVVPHYGMEYRLEVIDATTDRAVGTGFLTTQGLLQQQRDYLVEEKRVPFLSFLRAPIRCTELRPLVVELRTGFKPGVDFFTPTKTQPRLSPDGVGDVHTGDIIGCLELEACLEEEIERLYGPNPYACPPRPGVELNMAVFQQHVQRISNLLEDLKQIVETYRYVVSWKHPLVTGFSFVIFLRLTIWFDPAYAGSVPIFLLIIGMMYLAYKRAYGTMKAKYIQREIEKNRKAENRFISFDVHRPVGLIRVNISKGRNIRSPELGLAGNVGCRIFWDPMRFLPEVQRKKAIEVDESLSASHEFGCTPFVYGTEPTWDRMINSERAMRMNVLLPSRGTFFDGDVDENSISFPILQPISTRGDLQVLDPWESSSAAVVVEVRLTDLLNVIPGSEYTLGEVILPFRELLVSGEVNGWYNVVGSFAANDESQSVIESSKSEHPQLFVNVRWQPPPENTSNRFLETEREASYAIQEEMVRSAILIRSQKEKVNLLVSSMGALNNVRGISANLQMIQNQLGSALDFFESCLHGVDFSDPYKSSMVLTALCVLWLILSLVSTRMIVLGLGITQYTITFMARFERWMRSGRSSKVAKSHSVATSDKVPTQSPFIIWILNAIRGLPTSEDLRKTYFWESRRMGSRETESLSAAKRKSRMQRLWRVQWYGTVQMLIMHKTGSPEWRSVFIIVQGHRLLWWRSMNDFDSGISPMDRLLLSGHAGFSSPSPLELREISPNDVERVICVFGSGSRVTMLVSSLDVREDIERVVEAALSTKAD